MDTVAGHNKQSYKRDVNSSACSTFGLAMVGFLYYIFYILATCYLLPHLVSVA